MKKNLIILGLMVCALVVYAQSPEKMTYQAVIRSSNNQLVADQDIGVQINILYGTEDGPAVYSETHTPTTNANGLMTIEIGDGVSVDDFSAIDWSNGPFYIETKSDPTGGTDYTIIGVSQLLSVPYALYAEKSGNEFVVNGNPQSGDLLYNDGAEWKVLTKGENSDVLKLVNNIPVWSTPEETFSVQGSAEFGSVLYFNDTNWVTLRRGENDQILKIVDSIPQWSLPEESVVVKETPVAGDILCYNGSDWELLSIGVNNQVLKISEGIPGWNYIIEDTILLYPSIFTSPVTEVTTTSAKCGGYIASNGDSEIIAYGICWSTNPNPTIVDSITVDGSGLGHFIGEITEIEPGVTYYIRAYATNSTGTNYGNQQVLETSISVLFPTVSTSDIVNITANAAVSGGTISSNGGASVLSSGVCWSEHQNPTIADNLTSDTPVSGVFQSQISGLLPGTYYVRAYATNSAGTGYGNLVSFTTESTLPILTTKEITDTSAMGATSGGVILSDGGTTILERGICWSESPNPTITDNKSTTESTSASYSTAIIKAAPSTNYYLKAFASNAIGTGYGEQKSFTTLEAEYYTGFETGMTPVDWSGPFTVSSESAFAGSYSLMSLYDINCSEELAVNLTEAGQVSFYYKFYNEAPVSLSFYIDDVLISTFNNDGSDWKFNITSISSGVHIIKWTYTDYPNNNMPYNSKSKCYIDHITITK